LQISMYALPATFKNVTAKEGVTIEVEVNSSIGGSWTIVKTDNCWELSQDQVQNPTAKVAISPEIAWKLFSKAIRPNDVIGQVAIEGDRQLGEKALEMVAVMA
jgi:hypothetical protein